MPDGKIWKISPISKFKRLPFGHYGTNGLSSSKPYAYFRIVWCSVSFVCLLRHVSQRVGLIVIPGCLDVCLSVRASGRWCCCVAATGCCVAAVRSRWDSGSRQTLLVLQFLIEFANIWAQYCPWTYASTHVGFFLFVS